MVADPQAEDQIQNDALLAQILMQQEEEEGEENDYAASSWDVWGGVADSPVAKRPRSRKRGNDLEAGDDDDDDDDEDWCERRKAPAPRGRASHEKVEVGGGKAPRQRPSAWSAEEERRFLEALETYGRDWQRCAAHVGTRSANNFRSHAQKYFIKLYSEGQPVPSKVAESGAGHTLSGKPLDPNSAAARAYLNGAVYRRELQRRNRGAGEEESDEVAAQMAMDAALQPEEQQPEGELGNREPTEYVRQRPKRTTVNRRSIASLYNVSTEADELRFVNCMTYEDDDDEQPFGVRVQPRAALLMDLHAHLDENEVIGFLGGRYEAAQRQVQVVDAFPCRAAGGSAGHTDVELDAESAVEARAHIEASGLEVVGWYHSHPTFRPDPSVRDVENQRNYQRQFEGERAAAPFVGAIVSPYDMALPTACSRIRWFHVGIRAGDDGIAYLLREEKVGGVLFAGEEERESLVERVGELLKQNRVRWDKRWIHHSEKGELLRLARVDKVRESLLAHVGEEDEDGREWVEWVVEKVSELGM
ncbi:hypothetical protein CDCA_CDCA08G2564 [Cyanidium caldarium]|uniref:Myb-like, SWIRM and MPN domain-containing protein 1 n=1 Tax=Cyanidium caldarium TaxID=2771 RepID=A0AAV9IWP4_CYACA|nr:hypothetical protein CDCA_CDCA08G2564 [Cyanidium caldarium]